MKLLQCFLLFICINCFATTSKVLIEARDRGQNKSYIVEHMGGKKSLITTHDEGQNKSFIVGHSRNGMGMEVATRLVVMVGMVSINTLIRKLWFQLISIDCPHIYSRLLWASLPRGQCGASVQM